MVDAIIPRNCEIDGPNISVCNYPVRPIKDDARDRCRSAVRTSILNFSRIKGQILYGLQPVLCNIAGVHQIATEKIATCRCDL